MAGRGLGDNSLSERKHSTTRSWWEAATEEGRQRRLGVCPWVPWPLMDQASDS